MLAHAHVLHCSCVSRDHFCLYEGHLKNMRNSSVAKLPAGKNDCLDVSQKKKKTCSLLSNYCFHSLCACIRSCQELVYVVKFRVFFELIEIADRQRVPTQYQLSCNAVIGVSIAWTTRWSPTAVPL